MELRQALRKETELRILESSAEPAREHISSMWEKLTRTHESWFLGAMEDSKVEHVPGQPYYLYISPEEDKSRVEREVRDARAAVVEQIYARAGTQDPVMCTVIDDRVVEGERLVIKNRIPATEENLPQIEVRVLQRNPQTGSLIPPPADQHGLLYLPHPYVVPGVRFNEMYGWDTAFVVRGLLRDGEFQRAKWLTDNLLYEVKHYGAILNGNRTYYLDENKPRSHPPLLTGKIRDIYNYYRSSEEESAIVQRDAMVPWLKDAMEQAERYHDFFLQKPHIPAGAEEGNNHVLSLYDSERKTPGDEVLYSEPEHYDVARNELSGVYDTIKEKLQQDFGLDIGAILKAQNLDDQQAAAVSRLSYQMRRDLYYIEQYLTLDEAGHPAQDAEGRVQLSEQFYRGDWAMRESGFDPSRRFGFFNVDIINHIPVCLNSLRHKMEKEMGALYGQLAQDEPGMREHWRQKETEWEQKAGQTREAMQELWDPGDGNRLPSFRDKNINEALNQKYNLPEFREYAYATALFPMWAGVATPKQAEQIVTYIMPQLMSANGLNTSRRKDTGSQWDYPLMWAPLQVAAMEALERYGYYEEAWKIGERYAKAVIREYGRTGKMWEKLSSETGTNQTAIHINKGYATNDEGFAWTNSAVVEIMHALPRLLQKIQGKKVTHPDIAPVDGVKTGEFGYPEPRHLVHLTPAHVR